MERNLLNRILVAAGLVLLAGAGGYYYYKHRATDAPPVAPAPVAEVAASQEPVIENPLPAPPPDAGDTVVKLPELAASDAPLATDLGILFGAESVANWLVPDMLVRRLVATVDSLPRTRLADRLRPVRTPEGLFAVNRIPATEAGEEDSITLAEENWARYDSAVRLVEAADMQQVAKLYTRYYPLFQQSYEELGFPKQYFNDRLVAVIDHLLQTPDVDQPVKLTQPKVFYEFADPALEARSSGQKLLLRMGPKNANAVKAKLRELRTAVAAPKPAA